MLAVASIGLIRFAIEALVIVEPPIGSPIPLPKHDGTAAEAM